MSYYNWDEQRREEKMDEKTYKEINNIREDIIKEIMDNMDISEQELFKDWVNNVNKAINSVPRQQRKEIYNKVMSALASTNILSRRKYPNI